MESNREKSNIANFVLIQVFIHKLGWNENEISALATKSY